VFLQRTSHNATCPPAVPTQRQWSSADAISVVTYDAPSSSGCTLLHDERSHEPTDAHAISAEAFVSHRLTSSPRPVAMTVPPNEHRADAVTVSDSSYVGLSVELGRNVRNEVEGVKADDATP
jgi:hypothetical protein